MVVVRLPWLSGRALVAQARGVLGSTPGGLFTFLYFRLITSKFIYKPDWLSTQWSVVWE